MSRNFRLFEHLRSREGGEGCTFVLTFIGPASGMFRRFMPALADRWRLLAPDLPGCGYSDTPAHFRYDFDGYALFFDRFVGEREIRRYALYLHDFGSQIGLRLAMRAPERVAALIIQNGDI